MNTSTLLLVIGDPIFQLALRWLLEAALYYAVIAYPGIQLVRWHQRRRIARAARLGTANIAPGG